MGNMKTLKIKEKVEDEEEDEEEEDGRVPNV